MSSLASVGWVFNLLDVMGSLMPFAAFGVTKDWRKSFDCFGAMSLFCDLLISVLKANLYLAMTGLKPSACPVITDALCVCCFCIAFSTCALLFFVSIKSAHGVKHAVVRWMWFIILAVLASVGWIMNAIQEALQSYNSIVLVISGGIMVVQTAQAAYPALNNCNCKGRENFVPDETKVLLIKSVACIVTVLTSLYDCWSYWNSLKPYVTYGALCSHRAMCLVGTLAAVAQLVTRILNLLERISAGLQKIMAGWGLLTSNISTAWKSLVVCLGGVVDCLKSCAIRLWSPFSIIIGWIKESVN